MIQHIKKIFLAIIVISCLACFQRADYNLPLFVFSYFLWDLETVNLQRARLFYLFAVTWFIDFVWILYWGVTWGSSQYRQNGQAGLSDFVLVLSIIEFIIKLIAIGILFLFDSECKLAVRNIVPNIKSIFVFSQDKEVVE